MTIDQLITMSETRLSSLEGTRRLAEQIGDVDQVMLIDKQISEVNDTLLKLRSIPSEPLV